MFIAFLYFDEGGGGGGMGEGEWRGSHKQNIWALAKRNGYQLIDQIKTIFFKLIFFALFRGRGLGNVNIALVPQIRDARKELL